MEINLWFYVSIYLLLSMYMYFTLKILTKDKKFKLQDWLMFIFIPIIIWLYPIIAIPKIINKKLLRDLRKDNGYGNKKSNKIEPSQATKERCGEA